MMFHGVDILTAWSDFYASGGFVMPPLVVATIVLWYALGWRLATLQRGSGRPVYELVESGVDSPSGIIDHAVYVAMKQAGRGRANLRARLDEEFYGIREEMTKFSAIIRSIVIVAPLAGLLGTVGGMIETFDALGDMSLFSQSGGIAGGISQALISTQMGLAVAVPGVIAGRILDRRQHEFEAELERIKDIVCSKINKGPK